MVGASVYARPAELNAGAVRLTGQSQASTEATTLHARMWQRSLSLRGCRGLVHLHLASVLVPTELIYGHTIQGLLPY